MKCENECGKEVLMHEPHVAINFIHQEVERLAYRFCDEVCAREWLNRRVDGKK